MVSYIGVVELAQLLRTHGIAVVIERLAKTIHEDYLRWPSFEKCARIPSYSPDGVIELMPTADARHYAFKYVNGHPSNPLHDKLTVTAFGVLADMSNGYPLLLSELTLATALRTAATSCLAAAHMARPGSRSMAVLGNGSQSEFQIVAFHRMLGIDAVRLFDIDAAASRKVLRNLSGIDGLHVRVARSAAEAVDGADIITTLTARNARQIVVDDAGIAPGTHLNAVGGDSPGKTELDVRTVARSRVVVEYEPQTRLEGEIQQMPADFAVQPLWRVLAGQVAGRTDPGELTLFDSVGFALEDFSTLRFLYEASRGADALLTPREIDLVPMLADPKDLFGMVRPPQALAGLAALPAELYDLARCL